MHHGFKSYDDTVMSEVLYKTTNHCTISLYLSLEFLMVFW